MEINDINFMLFLTTSVLIGLLFGLLIVFFKLRKNYAASRLQLTQLKTEYEALSNQLYEHEKQRKLDSQLAAKEKLRLETDIQRLQQEKTDMESRFASKNSDWKHKLSKQSRQIEKLETRLSQLVGEKANLEERVASLNDERYREKEEMAMEQARLEAQLQQLERERADAQFRLDEINDAWEKEKLERAIAAQSSARSLPADDLVTEKLPTGFAARNGNQAMTVRLERLEAEKKALEQQLTAQADQTQTLAAQLQQVVEELVQFEQNSNQSSNN